MDILVWKTITSLIIGALSEFIIVLLLNRLIRFAKKMTHKKVIEIIDRRMDKKKSESMITSYYHIFDNYSDTSKMIEIKSPGTKYYYYCLDKNLKDRITDNTTWVDNNKGAYLDDCETTNKNAAELIKVNEKDYEEKLTLATKTVVNKFLEKLKGDYPFFNGEMYGVYKITPNKDRLILETFKCDYYTHRIMAEVYSQEFEEKRDIAPICSIEGKLNTENKMRSLNSYKYYLTSMGVDILIYLADEDVIVLCKRSSILFGIGETKKPRWHMSVNEAISITDLEDNSGTTISLEKCVSRGIKEELGVSLNHFKNQIVFGDVFLLKNPIEIGITAFVQMSGISFDEVKISYMAAKDGNFETTDIMALKCSDFAIRRFIRKAKREDEITHPGEYLLNMFLARGNDLIFLKELD